MLAQYAPPAELLLTPANEFVEDFVGADRALKRLALLRVRDWTSARRRSCAWASRSPGARQASPTADVPYPLLVDDERPPARLALRDARSPANASSDELRSQAEPVVELDDVLRDALSRPARREPSTARSSTTRRASSGVLSIEIGARAAVPIPRTSPGAARPHDRSTLAQVQIRDRTRACVADNGFCPELDRGQLRPLHRPVLPARLADGGGGR